MLLGALGANLLGNILTGKEMLRAGYGNKDGKRMPKAGYGSKGSSIKDLRFKKKNDFTHPFRKFEIEKYYRNEPRFNGVSSGDNLDGAYVTNLDKYRDAVTHWIALYVKTIEIIYFDSCGVEILKMLKTSLEIKT